MKKSISLMLLLAAMLLPTAMHAQGTAISSFPWTCDFEDADVNAVWQFSNTAPNNWIVGTAVNNTTGGDSALYISNNGTANTYDGSPALVSYAYVTLSISAAGQYAVQYDWMCEGESTYDFLRVAVSDAATTLPTSFSSWTATSVPSGFLAADGGSKLNLQGTTWQTQTAVFSVDAAGTYRLVFVWRNDGSVVHDGPAAIDNVTITELSCPQPTGLASTYIDPNQIDLSWTAGGSETSWILVVNDEDVYNPSTTSYSLTGLTPNTVYNIKLYAFCGAGDTSFATEGSFRTACVPISTLPYSNDFEDDPYYLSGTTSYEEAFPSCWTRINDATGTYNYYPYLSTSASYVIHGEKSLYWYHSNTSTYANNQYAVLPPVDPDAYSISDLTLSFYAKTTSTAAPFPQFIVGVMDDPEDVTTFVPLDTITLTTTATLYVESLADYTGSGNYIAIRSPRTSTSTVKYASLDDVYLTDAWCYPPTNVTYTATTEEITLNWDNIEGATFTVVLGEDTISGVADTTYTFSGLNPNTHLAYGVATECTSSNSFFVGGNAHTLCLPLDTLPYVQDFEDAAVGSSTSEDFVDCMERLNNGTQYFGYPYVSSTASYNHTEGGGKGLYWYGSTTTGTYGDYYIISLPAADPGTYPINTLQVRFWARATSTSYHPQFIVGVMTDPTDASTFEAVQVVDVEGTTFAEYTVAFGGYTGEGMYAAIKAVRPTSTWYAAMDDITLEPMPNCPAVTDLAATPTVASVLLTWGFQTGYEDPGQYEVVYDSIGGTTPFTMTVNGTFTAISGLEPGTTYKAYVRANCGVDGFGTWDSIEFLTGIFGCAQLDPATADTIVVGDSTLTTYYVPVNNYYNYSYTQELILASELNGATTFTGIDFDYAYTTPSTDKTNVTLYLVNTLDSTLASAFVPYNASTFVQVYQGPLNCTQGWNHFEFDTPFSYDGTSNLLVVVHDNSGDYNGSSYVFHGHSASGKVRYMQNDSSPYDITALSGSGTSGSTRANMKLYAGDCIATEVCSAPAAVVTDVTSSTVTLAWAPGAEESYWSLDYRLDGDTTWTTEASNVSVNTYTFTGLADGTSYEFRVSFVCSDAVGASYECVVSATTNCVPKPLPYVMDFDTVGMLGSGYGVMPGCWDYVLTGTSTYTTGTYLPGIYSSSSYAASGSYCLRLAGVGYFTLPEVDAQLDSLRITFNDTITSANYNGLVVGVMENGMFIPIDTVDIEIGVRNYFEVPFSDYHGTSRTIAFKNFYATSTTTYYSYHYIDDIVVDYIPECVHVENLTIYESTPTSVSLSWVPVGTETQWAVVYGDSTLVTPDTTAVLTGLVPDSSYTFYVHSICGPGDTSEAAWLNFRTPCVALSVPYMEDFESYGTGSGNGISTCWRKGASGTTSTYPYPYSYNAITGSRSLYFYAYHPSSSTSLPVYSYAALPLFNVPVDSLMLNFKVRRYSTTSTYYTSRLVIGVMTDPNDIATFFPMDTIDLKDAPGSSVHGYEYYFNNYQGEGQYIAIYDEEPPLYGTGTYSYSYVYVDDVTVDYIPACPRPTNLTFTNITQTTATVHWSHTASSFDIEYGPSGFTPGTGTTVTSSVDNVNLTGLTPSTTYDVYVRANCSATETSEWSFAKRFSTECGPIALPVTYDLEAYATGTSAPLPLCWSRASSAATYDYYPYISSTSSYAHSGNNSIYHYFYSSSSYPTEQGMVLPEIDVTSYPMNGNEVVFWARSTAAGKHYQVGVMTNPNDLSTFVLVDSVLLSTTYAEYTVSLNSYTGTGAYIALKSSMEGSSSYNIYVDDIFVSVASPCPRSYDLTAFNGTPTTVDLAWTDTIGSTQWVVSYSLLNSNTWTNVTANTNPFTLTGLTANTNYRYRVAPICSDGTQADWSRMTYRFSTSQPTPAAMPYSYNFEDGAEWANWQTNSNNAINWYRGNVAQGNSTYAMYLSADSGATHSWNMNIRTNAVAYRDIDFGTDTACYDLTFNAYFGGTVDHNYDGISVFAVDPADYVEAQDVNITSPWGNVNEVGLYTVRHDTAWGSYSVSLDGMTGVRRIVFYHFNQSTGGNYAYDDNPAAVDNIGIAIQPCQRPYNLTALSVAPTSVNLQWVGDDSATYQVAYRVAGADPSTNVYVTVSGNTNTITGLTPATTYYLWVQHICDATLSSEYSDGIAFSTPCVPLSLPYFEDFNNVTATTYSTAGELPDCWDAYSNGTSANYFPHVVGSGSYWYSPDTTNSLTLTSGSETYGDTKIVALPQFSTTVNNDTMSFFYRYESATNGSQLYVGYVTGPDFASTFVPVATITPTTTITADTVVFSDIPAEATRIAFKWVYTTSFYSVGIDNVSVWGGGVPCTTPVNLTADTSSYNSLTFNWADADSAEVVLMEGLWNEDNYDPATSQLSTTGTVTFTGLDYNTQYSFAVRQVCGEVTSDWVMTTVYTADLPCFAPGQPTVTETGYYSASFNWTAGGLEQAWLVRVYNSTFEFTDTALTTAYTVEGLTPNVTYNVTVSSLCGDGYILTSEPSPAASFTTDSCAVPTGLAASQVTANSAVISWNGTGAVKYELEYGDRNFNQGTGTLVTVTGGATTYTLTGLEQQNPYDVYVRAYCDETLYSGWSAVAHFTTTEGEGINDVNGADINLYPNPASASVTLTGIEGEATVTIVDLNGRTVYTTTASSSLTIDLTGYAKGAYFVRVTGEQTSAIRKLIVK